MSDQRLAWIALNLIPGIGPVTAHRLSGVCGSAAAVFDCTAGQLMELGGVKSETASALAGFSWRSEAEKELERCRRAGCQLVTWEEAEFPPALRTVPVPPTVLYWKGTLLPRDQKALAVVGTRRPTRYGCAAARAFASELSRLGYTIVSGLALGIDAHAHDAVLEAQGRTLAVLAHGLDQLYPPENRELLARVIRQGCALTEFPFGSPPSRAHFPQRNRVISGLAQGVLVVEAGSRSGALITARWAAELGREVFAVPGPYNSPLSRGAHALIQDGAKLVTGVEDIVSEIRPLAPDFSEPSMPAVRSGENPEPSLTPVQQCLHRALTEGEQHIDKLAEACGQPVQQVLSELLSLELKGWVQSIPGQRYQWIEN